MNISLNQGNKFIKYQDRIKQDTFNKENIEKKENRMGREGFINVFQNEIQNRKKVKQENAQDSLSFNNLKTQYETLMNQYVTLSGSLKTKTNDILARTGTNDKYKGQNIRYEENGNIGYVTEEGVFKWYNSVDNINATAGVNGCPALPQMSTGDWSNFQFNIPGSFSSGYDIPGTLVPGTDPQLITGTPMVTGQSCGNEGSNVYVNKMVNNPSISYKSCSYNKAPKKEYIVNGDFSDPMLTNDSKEYFSTLTKISGWSIIGGIANNSDIAPFPYPAGNQCCYLENTDNITQTVTGLEVGAYVLSFYGVMMSNLLQGFINVVVDGVSITEIGPGSNWDFFQYPINITNSSVSISLTGMGGQSAGNTGTCIQGISLKLQLDSNSAMEDSGLGLTSYDSCKMYAQDKAFKYFGIQNVQENGKGNCYVSNDLTTAQQYGDAINNNNTILWNSNASGSNLLKIGACQFNLYNSSNGSINGLTPIMSIPDSVPPECQSFGGGINSVNATWGGNCSWTGFNVPTGNATAAINSFIQQGAGEYNYQIGSGSIIPGEDSKVVELFTDYNYGGNRGTYGPGSYCADGNIIPNDTVSSMKVPQGMSIVLDAYNAPYTWKFGPGEYPNFSQMPYNGTTININDSLTCWDVYEDVTSSAQDPAPGCMKAFDISYKCGNTTKTGHIDGEAGGQYYLLDCSQETAACACYLILQSDGNLCLYKGTPTNPIMPGLWCAMTNGKQKTGNPDWVSSKGKYGRNYMVTGETLEVGEWIGSDDGSLKLIMQADGNLNLLTNSNSSACIQKDYGLAGPTDINAIYEISQVGNSSLLGKVGYINGDLILGEYSADLLGKSFNYDIFPNTNSLGNDLNNIINSNVDDCKQACNENEKCGGFVFDNSFRTCYLKDTNMFPKTPLTSDKDASYLSDTYVRQPELLGVKCSNKMMGIDSIQYANYVKGPQMTSESQCKIETISDADKQQLQDLTTQLANLEDQISSSINELNASNTAINTTIYNDYNKAKQDIKEYVKIQVQLNDFNPNKERTKYIEKEKLKVKNKIKNNNMVETLLNMQDINTMLNDSDLTVLERNYQFILWTIFAIGAIIITINIVKK